MQLSNARAIGMPGWYDVTVTLADDDPWVMATPYGPKAGQPFDYTIDPNDDAPLAEAIRKMVEEQAIEIASYVPPAPTADDVSVERDNRTFPGPILVTSDALPRAIPVDMRVQKDRDNLGNLTTGAIIAKASGKTGPYINFGDADNAVTPLTADQVIILGTAGLIYGSAVWEASRALKKMDPIPPDFRDDKYWPVPAVTI